MTRDTEVSDTGNPPCTPTCPSCKDPYGMDEHENEAGHKWLHCSECGYTMIVR